MVVNGNMTNKELLIEAIEKAIEGENVRYILVDDILEFERYEEMLIGNKYVIQQFGDYYVAFIF